MQYRAFEHRNDGLISDVFDGEIYKKLRGKFVEVNGEKMCYEHFSDPRDVALGLSTDGFAPFRKRKYTAWPLILFNYNLGPEERFHRKNIISLGVIPGPKKPHDTESFLYPFIEELVKLAVGVAAFDILKREQFLLRAFLIILFGDIPAMSLLLRMKGHNALCPCRFCEILGVRIPNNTATTHYVPLDRKNHPAVLDGSSAVASYDARELPMRTTASFLKQGKEVDNAPTKTRAEELSKVYGIKGSTILSSLSSIILPFACPYDYMHLMWENLIKNLILFWTGEFKGLDASSSAHYVLPQKDWEAIGAAGAAANATIPAAYSAKIMNISGDRTYFTADGYSFWALYIAPVLLRGVLDGRYYDHFIDLVQLLHICLKYDMTEDDLLTLREGFVKWVLKYERYVCSASYFYFPKILIRQ